MPEADSLVPSIPWVERENKRLVSILRTFDDAAWKRPSYCPGWTAAHIIGHMTLGAHFYASVVQSGCEGRVEPPFGAKDVAEFREQRISMMEDLAALSGEERIERFEEETSRLQVAFEALRPEDLDKPAWHPRCTTPVRYFPDQRLYELILHEWDIRNAPDSPLHPDALEVAVGILRERLPFFYNQSPDPRLAGAFRFETTDAAHTWGIEIHQRKASACPADGREFDVGFSAPSSDIVLLVSGRADTRAREAAGRLRIEGERSKADALMAVLFRPY